MPGLLDIANLKKTVQIGEGDDVFDVTVKGISGRKIAEIIQRFPAIGEIIFPTAPVAGQPSMDDPGSMIRAMPEAVAAIIVAGSVEPIEEDKVLDIPVGYQIDVLLAILDITLPGGLVPFINKLTRLFGESVSQVPPLAAGTQSVTSMPNGRASDSPLPSPSLG